MPHLTLNGVALGATELVRPASELIGEEGRAHSGADMSSVRARKGRWRARVEPHLQATAHAIRGLVQGDGYSWSFDTDLYADRKGLGPSSGTGTLLGGAKYGSTCLTLTTAAGITYPVGAGSNWTVLGWKRNFIDAAWHHFIRLSSGAKYKDGSTTTEGTGFSVSGADLIITPVHNTGGLLAWAPNGYSVGDLVVESGMVFQVGDDVPNHGDPGVEPNFAGAVDPGDEVEEDPGGLYGGPWIWVNAGDCQVDDVMFLPYLVPSDWISQLYTEAAARAWTSLPRLRLSGDVAAQLSGTAATVVGSVSDTPTLMGQMDGSFRTTLEPLDFELREA